MFTTAVQIQGEFEPWKDEGYLQESYYWELRGKL